MYKYLGTKVTESAWQGEREIRVMCLELIDIFYRFKQLTAHYSDSKTKHKLIGEEEYCLEKSVHFRFKEKVVERIQVDVASGGRAG